MIMLSFLKRVLRSPLLWGFVYGASAPLIFINLIFSYSAYAYFYLPIIALTYPAGIIAKLMDRFLFVPFYAKGLWCADVQIIWWCTKDPLIIFLLLNGLFWATIFFLLSWLAKQDARFLGGRS